MTAGGIVNQIMAFLAVWPPTTTTLSKSHACLLVLTLPPFRNGVTFERNFGEIANLLSGTILIITSI